MIAGNGRPYKLIQDDVIEMGMHTAAFKVLNKDGDTLYRLFDMNLARCIVTDLNDAYKAGQTDQIQDASPVRK